MCCISVKKKGGASTDIVKVGDRAEEQEVVKEQPQYTGVPLLANEEFEKEGGGIRSETEDNEEQSEEAIPVEKSSGANGLSKKRKASSKLHSSKYAACQQLISDRTCYFLFFFPNTPVHFLWLLFIWFISNLFGYITQKEETSFGSCGWG